MFIGHFGLGFAAKKIRQQPSLGTTFFAAQFIDLLWPFFLLTGIEKVEVDPGNTAFTPLNFISYPYSHSLLAVMCWGLLFGLAYLFIKKDGRTALLLGLLVVSHWLLDVLTHRPDLPLTLTGETRVGLGLWNMKTATLVIEILIFSLGVYLYSHSTRSKNKTGTYSFWALVIFLLVVYLMNVFGDPPPDARTIGYVGFAQWLLIIWGYWTDRNRTTRI